MPGVACLTFETCNSLSSQAHDLRHLYREVYGVELTSKLVGTRDQSLVPGSNSISRTPVFSNHPLTESMRQITSRVSIRIEFTRSFKTSSTGESYCMLTPTIAQSLVTRPQV